MTIELCVLLWAGEDEDDALTEILSVETLV
jgi:hypothetical protein